VCDLLQPLRNLQPAVNYYRGLADCYIFMERRECPAIHRMSVNDVLLHQGNRSPTENVREKKCPTQERSTVCQAVSTCSKKSKLFREFVKLLRKKWRLPIYEKPLVRISTSLPANTDNGKCPSLIKHDIKVVFVSKVQLLIKNTTLTVLPTCRSCKTAYGANSTTNNI
jgi:hypothetical protein